MTENRMLVVSAEVAERIDNNRGDMSISDFINFLIDSQLREEAPTPQYATKEDISSLEQDMKKLMKSIIDFFVNYGFELKSESSDPELRELASKLEGLRKGINNNGEKGKATIKWE